MLLQAGGLLIITTPLSLNQSPDPLASQTWVLLPVDPTCPAVMRRARPNRLQWLQRFAAQLPLASVLASASLWQRRGNRLKDSLPSKHSGVDVQGGCLPINCSQLHQVGRQKRRGAAAAAWLLIAALAVIGALWPWNRSLCSSRVARRCKDVYFLAVLFNCMVSLQDIWLCEIC